MFGKHNLVPYKLKLNLDRIGELFHSDVLLDKEKRREEKHHRVFSLKITDVQG